MQLSFHEMQEMQESLKNSAVQLETCTLMQSEWLWASQVMNFEHARETMIHCILQMTREGSYWLLLLGDQLDKGWWQCSDSNDSNNKKICSILEQMLLNSECISPQKYIRIIWSTHWWMYSSDKNLKFMNLRKNWLPAI